MSWLESIFLGVVQGLTEFLPVSSSGHLVAFQHFLKVSEGQLTFDVAVHVGTLLSVLTIYYRPISQLVVGVFGGLKSRTQNASIDMFFFVFLASIPTGLMGVFLRDYWSSIFAQMHWVGVFLCVTGVILALTKRMSADDEPLELTEGSWGAMTWKKALIIGFAQGFAILPGISRSGTTIAVGLMLGIEKKTAAFFSFLLMIPAVLGATLLELSHVNWDEVEGMVLFIGFVTSYISGLAGLLFVLRVVKKGRLELFSPYLWLVGGGLFVYAMLQ